MPAKIAYLTIDDAPSSAMAEKADHLLDLGIPAVWFCLGDLLEQRPEHALHAIQQGFILGNHAYSHLHFSELTVEEGWAQIRRTDEILDELYARSGLPRTAKYFRFPFLDKGGANRAAFQVCLAELGYTPSDLPLVTYPWYRGTELAQELDWWCTYDTKDWALNHLEPVPGFENIDKVLARMDEDHPEDGRGLNDPASAEIVLMHDQERTKPHFYRILARLLEKGLRFAPVA